MIKKLILACVTTLALFAAIPSASANGVEIGKPAPDFTGTDTQGKSHKLSDFKGKTVVLEWTNPGCPFVLKHYDSSNMQKLQKEYTDKGVIWLSIVSSAQGEQGNQTPEESNAYMTKEGSTPTARLLDPSGEIGQLYEAKTTPHMFVINPEGILAYKGAIDDNDSTNPEDAAGAKNYVRAAVDSILAGKPVETTQTKPYGCSVKYKS